MGWGRCGEGLYQSSTGTLESSDHTGKLLAYANITICDAFVVKNLKVINGRDGLFVAMPSRKGTDDVHRDIAHPVNQETRDYVEAAVLDVYEQTLEQQKQKQAS